MSKKDIDVDAYSKALLDKKEEYNKEEKTIEKPHTMSPEERRQAEKTMSSALDMLRKERGQKTIAEEEKFYEEHKDDLKDLDDEVTTSAIEKEQPNEALNLVHAMLQDMSNEEDSDSMPEVEELEKPVKKEKKAKAKSKPKKEKKEPKPKKSMKKVTKIILVFVFLGLVALGGYSYKVLIYDPQNIVSSSQQKTYDKLVSYADEYGDNMMSDAEKLELLDLNSDYKKLLDKQKTSINAYFKEQTGKTYKALLKEMKELQQSKEEANMPAYQQIVNLLNSWDSQTNDQKYAVIDMQSTYSSLSKSLKKQVDSLSQSKTGKNFMDLCKEESSLKAKANEESAKAEEEQKKADNEKQIQEYQANLNSAQSDYNTYSQYAQSLESDLALAQQNGEDTTDIESQINTNNQMLSSLQQQISYYQQQISALQS